MVELKFFRQYVCQVMAIYYNSRYWCDVMMTSSKMQFFETHIREDPIVMKPGGYVDSSPIMQNPKGHYDDVIM